MSWNANVPQGTQSPGLFPTQAQTNWTRLFAIISADHNFTTSADATQGYHKVIRLVNQTSNPAAGNNPQTWTIDTSYNRSGANVTSEHLWYRPTSGTDTNTFPISVSPIRAFVNFDGTISGNNAAQTIRSSFNVASVTRYNTDTGRYKITFTSALPSDGYAVSVTGRRSTSGDVFGMVLRSNTFATYASAVTTTFLYVEFRNHNDSQQDVDMGNIIIVGG